MDLPYELVYQILLASSIDDVIGWCQVGGHFTDICNDELFWKQRLNKDYPDFSLINQSFNSYKDYYKYLYNNVFTVPVYIRRDNGDELVTMIKLSPLIDIRYILNKIHGSMNIYDSCNIRIEDDNGNILTSVSPNIKKIILSPIIKTQRRQRQINGDIILLDDGPDTNVASLRGEVGLIYVSRKRPSMISRERTLPTFN